MSIAQTPRVMIVDDHSIMRDGLKELLERSGAFEVVGQAQNGLEAVAIARSLRPGVVIMDVMMPEKDGIDACREIREAAPNTRVLILTASTDEDAVIAAVDAGATGYLQKFSGKEQLLAAIRDVAEGEFTIPGELTRQVLHSIHANAQKSEITPSDGLTDREREILTLYARGLSYAQIAEVRGNRPLTIRNAIYGIRDKLGTNSIQEMVVWAVRSGLLDEEPPHGAASEESGRD